jgi:hypothetical protein|mmetsp:Transcript_38005/g.60215  ORF Transcript_38005/g.60215 Transcript_38005/m.60215 type:complete len:565 (-) Transcript_38005:69-1763(-)
MKEIDETVDQEPEWYGNIIRIIARDKAEEALRQAMEALAKCRKSSDKAGEVAALRAVTKANIAKGDLWNAKRTADEGLQLAKESGNKKAEAAALHAQAAVHLKEKQPDQAKFKALAAVDAYKALQNRTGEACASNSLALAYMAKKEIQQAHDLASQALQIFKADRNNGGRVFVSYTIVQIYLEQGEKEEALGLLAEMATVYGHMNDFNGIGLVNLASAEIYLASFDLQMAIDKATSASELFGQTGDSKKRGASVYLMAKAFDKTGQAADMLSCALAAYGYFEEARDQRGKALCLEMAGKSYTATRDFKPAIFSFENAAFLFRQSKDKAKEAELLDELAKAQLESLDTLADTPATGWQPDDILAPVRNSKRACAVYIELGAAQSVGHAQALQTLALALLNTTAHEEAFGRTLESQRIFKLLGDVAGEAGAVITGARVLAAQKQNDQALKLLESAAKLAEESGDPASIRRVQVETARVQKMAKPVTAASGKKVKDFFIAVAGDEMGEYSYFESRVARMPEATPQEKGTKGRLVAIDKESAPRVPQQYPVLFETRKMPANILVSQAA